MQRADSLEKTLRMRKVEGKRRRGWQRMRRFYSITYSRDMNLSKLQEIGKDRVAWHDTVHGVSKNQIRLSDEQQDQIWTVITWELVRNANSWVLSENSESELGDRMY